MCVHVYMHAPWVYVAAVYSFTEKWIAIFLYFQVWNKQFQGRKKGKCIHCIMICNGYTTEYARLCTQPPTVHRHQQIVKFYLFALLNAEHHSKKGWSNCEWVNVKYLMPDNKKSSSSSQSGERAWVCATRVQMTKRRQDTIYLHFVFRDGFAYDTGSSTKPVFIIIRRATMRTPNFRWVLFFIIQVSHYKEHNLEQSRPRTEQPIL